METGRELLSMIDRNQALQIEYDNRPFKAEYEELEGRLLKVVQERGKIDLSNPIPVSAEEHMLIWREDDALQRRMKKIGPLYSTDMVYSFMGLATFYCGA